MNAFKRVLLICAGLVLSFNLLHAQQTELSNFNSSPDSLSDLQTMLEAIESVPPVPFEATSKQQRFGTFWSAQHPPGSHNSWPPLPSNNLGLPVWPIGDSQFILDDRSVRYDELQAEAEWEAKLEAAASLNSGGTQMRMMSSSLSSYAYGNSVYLTNMTASLAYDGSMTANFSIGGGTNFVPYDILTSTNVAAPYATWNWLGIGYMSNSYTFYGQPKDLGFYILAKPSRTMTVGWGGNSYSQSDVPLGLTNALMVAGSFQHSTALLSDGHVVNWGNSYVYGTMPTNLAGGAMVAAGYNFCLVVFTNGTLGAWGDAGANSLYGVLNIPSGLSNCTVISAAALHSLALTTNGTVRAWGYDVGYGEATVPAALANVTAIAAGTWHNLAVSNGHVIAWGFNGYGQCTVPVGLSNVVDVAAGFTHSVALKKDGTVVCWGGNGDSESTVPVGLTGVVAVAADGYLSPVSGFTLAVTKDGSLVAWGNNTVCSQLKGADHVIAVAGGTFHGLVIRTGPPTPVITLQPMDQFKIPGSTVSFSAKGQGLYGVTYQWQTNGVNFTGATNTTLTLTNVQAAQQGSYRMIVNDNGGYGSIASSNASLTLVTPPVFIYQSQPTNIVTIFGKHLFFSGTAIAPGTNNGFPISYHWQFNGTNIASVTTNGYDFNVNDSSQGLFALVAQNAAGSASISWQVTVTNAINVTNDLLLIYNTNSQDSTTVLNYYLAHRPNVSGANVLGVGYTNPVTPTYFETATPSNLTSQIFNPLLNWLTNNPAKRPQYVILFMDLPSRCSSYSSAYPTNGYPYPDPGIRPSVSIQINELVADWQPYVTHLNMGMTNTVNRTNDCIAYINKLASIGIPTYSSSPVLSASAGGYANTNFVLDGVRFAIASNPSENFPGAGGTVSNAIGALLAAGVASTAISFYDSLIVSNYFNTNINNFLATHLYNGVYVSVTNYNTFRHATNAANVAGYVSWGVHGNIAGYQTYDGTITWQGNSGWWLINTIESWNGTQIPVQGTFDFWFLPTAFGGTNYSNTPIGAVTTVYEPGLGGKNDSSIYFSLWASAKNFGICAWTSKSSSEFQAIGDPLIIQ